MVVAWYELLVRTVSPPEQHPEHFSWWTSVGDSQASVVRYGAHDAGINGVLAQLLIDPTSANRELANDESTPSRRRGPNIRFRISTSLRPAGRATGEETNELRRDKHDSVALRQLSLPPASICSSRSLFAFSSPHPLAILVVDLDAV